MGEDNTSLHELIAQLIVALADLGPEDFTVEDINRLIAADAAARAEVEAKP